MAGKRTATSDLNHDNWDREDDPEEAGTFQRAADDIIKKRVIKTARRRNPISSLNASKGEEGEKKSVFAGFTAFAKTPSPASAAFGFLSNLTNKTEQPKTNGTTEKKEESLFSVTKTLKSFNTATSKENNDKSTEYYSKLKGLNESVAKWITKHVDTNPLINLQPVFKDYEKHFEELEKEEKESSTKNSSTGSASNKIDASSMGTFVFKKSDNVPDSTSEKPPSSTTSTETYKKSSGSSSVSFGITPPTTAPMFNFAKATTTTFAFGSSSNTSSTSTQSNQFSFGSSASAGTATSFSNASAPFSFSNVSKSPASQETNKDPEDEEEPPKVEFVPVVEEGHIYTTRCKVFVKKDGTFGDRGVGNLYLKPIASSEKVQLIVRADTNLGNLLCNFILSESIPMQRMGKKDVMLVCLPTPETKPPPLPILLRVKSSEDADNLLETLQKHKK